jgi:hypothetical protein
MFQVNRAENRIRRLEERRFGDLGLRERDHLQEWLERGSSDRKLCWVAEG